MKKKILRFQTLLAGFALLVMMVSCSSTENTVVIKDAPVASSKSDSTQAPPTESIGSFSMLTIGENQPIRSLDPLFIENASEMRANQLVFEGLLRYDENGKVVPAVAKSWNATNNQQTFQFTLRHNLFFQDSDVFNNGRGRRVVSDDIKKDFERMAKASVPHQAATLFMIIEGFEPYYQEQHQLLRSSDRQLDGVSGIETPNDSTVVFHLIKSDDHFLQKLATPYAAIYPQEAASSSGFKAVGTGPYRLSQQRMDSVYIFARFPGYHEQGSPKLNRIDIHTSSSETALLNALNNGDIDLIPQLGPRQMQLISNENGKLRNQFSSYTLTEFQNQMMYRLQYNPTADVSKENVSSALSQAQDVNFFTDLPQGSVQLNWTLSSTGSTNIKTLQSTYASDPLVRSFYQTLSQQLASKGINFTMTSSRVGNRNIALSTELDYPFFDDNQTDKSDNTLATLLINSWAISDDSINNLSFNQYPWWIDLRDVTINSTNR